VEERITEEWKKWRKEKCKIKYERGGKKGERVKFLNNIRFEEKDNVMKL